MNYTIHTGDAMAVLQTMTDASVNCCVTSPPYFGLRDYKCEGQIGLEPTPDEYVAKLVAVFREVKRVLRDDGTLWLNIGDSYASLPRGGRQESPGVGAKQALPPTERAVKWGSGGGTNFYWELPGGIKQKDLIGIPWRVAFALQADGWYLRQDIIWSKPNPMPESVRDRCTKAHEYLFMLSKSARYYYDQDAIKEPASEMNWQSRLERDSDKSAPTELVNGIRCRRESGKRGGTEMRPPGPSRAERKDKQRGHGRRHAGFNDRWDAMPKEEQCGYMRNKRSVWNVATKPFPEAHFAVFPPELIRPCILAGCPEGGTVLDPFSGAGTTGVVCMEEQREYIGIELNLQYVKMADKRIAAAQPQWFGAAL